MKILRFKSAFPVRLICALVVLIAALEAGTYLMKNRFSQNFIGTRESIWMHQVETVRGARGPADIIFLGDSTVKDAIDGPRISKALGGKVLNLGLTAGLGTYGDYAILKYYLNHWTPPKAIVLWHTIDVWPRSLDMQLLAFTDPDMPDLFMAAWNSLRNFDGMAEYVRWPIKFSGQLAANALMRIPSYGYNVWIKKEFSPFLQWPLETARPAVLAVDLSTVELTKQLDYLKIMDFYVSFDMDFWFKRLLVLCRENNIRVLVSRSTIHEFMTLDKAGNWKLDEINEVLTRYLDRFPVEQILKSNVVFAKEYGYDDQEHVGPQGRGFLTDYYAGLLRHKLRMP